MNTQTNNKIDNLIKTKGLLIDAYHILCKINSYSNARIAVENEFYEISKKISKLRDRDI